MSILNASAREFMPTSSSSLVNTTYSSTTSAIIPYNTTNTYHQSSSTSTHQSLVFYPFYHHYPTYGNFSSRFYPLLQAPSQAVTYCTTSLPQWQQLIMPSNSDDCVVHHDHEEAQVVDKEVVSVKVMSSRVSRPGRVVKGERFREIVSGGGGVDRPVVWKAKGLKGPEKVVKSVLLESASSLYKKSSGGIQSDGTSTTVMIRNIPNKYSVMLLELLDKHCEEENQRVDVENCDGINGNTSISAYDFVYLPIDFGTKCNKGYAFVNFTNPNAAYKLFVAFQHKRWNILNSRKICEITYARLQGKDELVKHFQKSIFACEEEEFLPICFDPHCDGSPKSRENAETKVVKWWTIPPETL
ncbi:hypothetical protein Scep_020547 [Stephania cephalantha]|uniref:Mei2-like C-terminal RNA recognition motif domain-containing protein n=1 Tax=Stephania cephalantha TaxID=152367 RepID=A0AAP0IDD1_9MAGN